MNATEITQRLEDAQQDARQFCASLAASLRHCGLIGDGAGDGPEAVRDYRDDQEEALHGAYLGALKMSRKLDAVYV